MSPGDLARELNLSVEKLEALENDQYEKLPSEVFAQGYLRRYGKLVGVDENMLVLRFNEYLARQRAAAEGAAQAEEESRPPATTTLPKWLLPAGIFVVALIVLALIFIRTAGNDGKGPVVDTPATQTTDQTELRSPQPAESDSGLDADGGGLPRPPDPLTNDVATEEDGATSESAGEDDTAAPAESPARDSSVPAEAADGNTQLVEDASSAGPDTPVAADRDRLSFAFSGDCWVEVSDVDGSRIHADLARAGESLQIEGRAPFSVMLGNARAVELSFNGETVPVNPRPGQRTMRLTLGD